MALLEDGLYSVLSGEATVTAQVGTRIYPMRAPQNATYPLAVYQRITGGRDAVHEDSSTRFAEARFQISVWAKTYRAAKVAAKAVVDFLHERTGAMGGTTHTATFVEDEIDDQDEETGLFRTILDVRVLHEES